MAAAMYGCANVGEQGGGRGGIKVSAWLNPATAHPHFTNHPRLQIASIYSTCSIGDVKKASKWLAQQSLKCSCEAPSRSIGQATRKTVTDHITQGSSPGRASR